MKGNLKEAREHFGYTQKEIAEAIGVPQRTYGSWERGERMYNAEDACRIADVYNCSMEYLLGRRALAEELEVKRESELLSLFHRLSPEGQEKLISYCGDLLANPAMRKE